MLEVAFVTAVVGMLGLAAGQPWLFPSLGPTAFVQAQSPRGETARPWNASVGHACAVASGLVSTAVVGASRAPGVLATGHLSGSRVAAAVLAVILTVLFTEALRARHAPAIATALLFAEGSYRSTPHDALLVAIGVAMTLALGEGSRGLRELAARVSRPATR